MFGVELATGHIYFAPRRPAQTADFRGGPWPTARNISRLASRHQRSEPAPPPPKKKATANCPSA